MLKLWIAVIALACSSCAAASDDGQSALAFDQPETRTAGTLEITSPAFSDGGVIPDRYSAWHEGISPQLDWSGVPEGTVSLVLFMEDPDAPTKLPYLHWVAWNIDPALTGLPENIAAVERNGPLSAMIEGRNSSRATGYFGPKPPGSGTHHYHFELFALDRTITLDSSAGRDEILAAMAGHVLAKGQLTGLYRKPG